eukprot:152643_1
MIALRLLKPNNLIPIRFCLMSFSIQSGAKTPPHCMIPNTGDWLLVLLHILLNTIRIRHCQSHPTQQLQKNDDPDDVYDPMRVEWIRFVEVSRSQGCRQSVGISLAYFKPLHKITCIHCDPVRV